MQPQAEVPMSRIDDTERAEAFATLDALLDGLAEMLAPQFELGWDDDLVVSLVEESLALAISADLAGVIELLKVWKTALSDQKRRRLVATGTGRLGISAWFGNMLRWIRQDLNPTARVQLLPAAISLLRLKPLTEKTQKFVQERLEASYQGLSDFIVEESHAQADSESAFAGDKIGTTAEPIIVQAAELPASEPTIERSAQAEERLALTQPSFGVTGDQLSLEPSATDSAELTEHASVDDTIWISQEELDMALEAITNQVLPEIYALAEDHGPALRAQHLEDLGFNLGLVGSAMEMLGTPVLSRAILDMQERVVSTSPPDPEVAVNWSIALVGYLQTPGEDSAELLIMVAADLPDMDANAESLMRAEAARIRVGLDPLLVSERKTQAEPEDIELTTAPDVLPQVLDGMLRELPGNAERLGAAIRTLIQTGDPAPIDEARRVAHTLKGDANTVGVSGLANLTHSLEDVLIELHKHPQLLVPELGSELNRAADTVEEVADFLLARGPEPTELFDVYQSILDWSNLLFANQLEAQAGLPGGVGEGELAKASKEVVADSPVAALPAADSVSGTAIVGVARKTDVDESTAVLSVKSSTLDELQRLAGETLVMARQIDQRLGLLAGLHKEQIEQRRSSTDLISVLDDLVSLRGAALQSTVLRGGDEVDPLELDQYDELHVVSKRLGESYADHAEYQYRLDALFHELDGLRTQQENFHSDLQRVVQRTRMVPFEQICGRLQRINRQTSRQLDRAVELQITGTETLVESELLDRVVEPLAHLLRNAIDHGIEPAQQRRDAEKPEIGSIALNVSTVADSIEIQLTDDGRGMDFEGIQSKAKEMGLLSCDAQPSRDELARLILLPGFSTKSSTSHVSGRGIGMDVVNQRILDLRGQLEIVSEPGRSTQITLRLPVSRTMANVIIVHGNEMIAGAVAGSVERVVSLDPDSLGYSDDGPLSWMEDGQSIPVLPIESLYGGLPGRPSLPPQSNLGLLLRTSSGRRMVISVASIGEVSSVIVKPISPHLPSIPAVRGMTLLGDGRLAAVVDMVALVDSLEISDVTGLGAYNESDVPRLPRVVIADDSLSVRRSLSQLMEDAGFEVAAARDGLEALQLIEQTEPAIVLLDLEMPKLNGLELTRYLRGRSQTKSIPVLMITSRASEKYQVLADAAGVSLMLGKPISEDDLISNVRKLMAREIPKVAALEHV